MTNIMAEISGTELISIIGIFAGMLGGFYAITQLLVTQAGKDRDHDRAERKQLSDAIRTMAESSQRVAEEIRVGNRQAEERNGHLGEQNIQITELIQSTKNDIINAVHNVKYQHVAHQTIEEEYHVPEHKILSSS